MLALYLDEDSMDQSLVAALRARGVEGQRGVRQILELISVKTSEQMENNVEFIKG